MLLDFGETCDCCCNKSDGSVKNGVPPGMGSARTVPKGGTAGLPSAELTVQTALERGRGHCCWCAPATWIKVIKSHLSQLANTEFYLLCCIWGK